MEGKYISPFMRQVDALRREIVMTYSRNKKKELPMPEKNALAKLAERLKPKGNEHLYFLIDYGDLYKASRIVAELSNADLAYANDPVSNNCVKLRLDAFKKCREIAEEGAR